QVRIEGLNCPTLPTPVLTTTDADGSYTACFTCSGCGAVTVTAVCCGASNSALISTCPSEVTVDVICRSCPTVPPPRPCPPPDAVQASGQVTCAQGAGTGTPLAGCTVDLVGLDPSGNPVSTATAVTAGRGS